MSIVVKATRPSRPAAAASRNFRNRQAIGRTRQRRDEIVERLRRCNNLSAPERDPETSILAVMPGEPRSIRSSVTSTSALHLARDWPRENGRGPGKTGVIRESTRALGRQLARRGERARGQRFVDGTMKPDRLPIVPVSTGLRCWRPHPLPGALRPDLGHCEFFLSRQGAIGRARIANCTTAPTRNRSISPGRAPCTRRGARAPPRAPRRAPSAPPTSGRPCCAARRASGSAAAAAVARSRPPPPRPHRRAGSARAIAAPRRGRPRARGPRAAARRARCGRRGKTLWPITIAAPARSSAALRARELGGRSPSIAVSPLACGTAPATPGTVRQKAGLRRRQAPRRAAARRPARRASASQRRGAFRPPRGR